MITLFSLFLVSVHSKSIIETTDYLQKYGYLNNSDQHSISHLEDALINFQDYYNLPVDGTLNNETINLMNSPRCGVTDSPYEMKTLRRWNKQNISWHFPLSNSKMKEIVTKVFNIWQEVTNLKFTYSTKNPDILISFSGKQFNHTNSPRCQTGNCVFNFDGNGGVLAHASFPNNDNCVEVHLDSNEDWYYEYDIAPESKVSLFAVLLHEIGHSLGLPHSKDVNSIMFGYYSGYVMELSQNDIDTTRNLYGLKQNIIPEKNTSDEGWIPANQDLCQIQPTKFLITFNQHKYIFHNDLVWILQIGEQKYRPPERIGDYLPFSSFSHIYQRPSGDLVVIVNNEFYIIEFPSLQIKASYNKRSVRELGILRGRKINCIFSSYRGTYIFYDNYYFVEIDECSFRPKSRGIISELFPGVPSHLDNASRYINGNLYFFRNKTFYEFNEFTRKITRAGEFDLGILDINCPNVSVLSQIRDLLSKLSVNA